MGSIFKHIYLTHEWDPKRYKRKTRGIVANILDCDVVVSEFELKSGYYVNFRGNTVENVCNPLFPNNKLNSTITVLLQRWIWY